MRLLRVLCVVAVLTSALPLEARLLRRRPARSRAGAIALRRRLHISPLITEPGTVEIDWNSAWSASRTFSMPATLKWTPAGSQVWWGRTELSANFDAVVNAPNGGGDRVTQTSDHLALAATALLHDGEHWNLALAPTVNIALRGDQATRSGLSAILRCDKGRSSGGATATWTGASPGANTPAGIWDVGAGFGHRVHRRLFAHLDAQMERATGYERTWSYFEGAEWEFTDRLSLDVTFQQLNAGSTTSDRQIVAGVTFNLGRPQAWFRREAR